MPSVDNSGDGGQESQGIGQILNTSQLKSSSQVFENHSAGLDALYCDRISQQIQKRYGTRAYIPPTIFAATSVQRKQLLDADSFALPNLEQLTHILRMSRSDRARYEKSRVMALLTDDIVRVSVLGDVPEMIAERCVGLFFFGPDVQMLDDMKAFLDFGSDYNLMTVSRAEGMGWEADDEVKEVIRQKFQVRSLNGCQLQLEGLVLRTIYIKETGQVLKDIPFFVVSENPEVHLNVVLGFQTARKHGWWKPKKEESDNAKLVWPNAGPSRLCANCCASMDA